MLKAVVSNTDAHSSLSTAFCLHLLVFFSRTSCSTSSNHLNLGLPFLLLLIPSGVLSNIFYQQDELNKSSVKYKTASLFVKTLYFNAVKCEVCVNNNFIEIQIYLTENTLHLH